MNKVLSILALAALLAPALSSCSDMLDTDSELVEYDADRHINLPSDTLYSVMGIVAKMQQVATRTLVLGDVRSDLVATTPSASTDLQRLANFDNDADNKYNHISDYYAIINNCNAYLDRVDSLATKRGKKVFEGEIAAVHTFRAWTYLQLALIYGRVPLITKPVMSESQATAEMNKAKSDLAAICAYFVGDLRPYMDTKLPQYGSVGGFNTDQLFYPVRVLMADLCLWAGDYRQAAQLYHDWLNYENNEVAAGQSGSVKWANNAFENVADGYSPMRGRGVVTAIPLESESFYGTINDAYYLYNSQNDHNFGYFQLQPAAAMQRITQAENYCYEDKNTASGQPDTLYAPKKDLLKGDLYIGDLRYASNYSTRHINQDAGSRYASDNQTISKVSTGSVCLLRSDIVWLHYAEALNRAGYPGCAMAVLKYGLCDENDSTYIDSLEVEAAGELISFNAQKFTKQVVRGIHENGCGNSNADTLYAMPDSTWTLDQKQLYVEDRIFTELALEGAFEGMRYYDLYRLSLRRGDWTIGARAIARRASKSDDDQGDGAIFAKLAAGPEAWWLPIK